MKPYITGERRIDEPDSGQTRIETTWSDGFIGNRYEHLEPTSPLSVNGTAYNGNRGAIIVATLFGGALVLAVGFEALKAAF
ncbi:hypothetical protein [Agrobacterium sp. CG674]